MTSSLEQRALNEINLEATYLIVEVESTLNAERLNFSNALHLAKEV